MATTTIDKDIYIVKIKQAIELIRPYLQTDGGDVEFIELTDDFIVKVKLSGSCKDCEMKAQTLELGIEHTIRKSVPEIKYIQEVS